MALYSSLSSVKFAAAVNNKEGRRYVQTVQTLLDRACLYPYFFPFEKDCSIILSGNTVGDVPWYSKSL